MKRLITIGVTTLAMAVLLAPILVSPASGEESVFMSADWADLACEAWNGDEELTGKLGKWMQNDLARGFKIMQIYRRDCEDSARVELRIDRVCLRGRRQGRGVEPAGRLPHVRRHSALAGDGSGQVRTHESDDVRPTEVQGSEG